MPRVNLGRNPRDEAIVRLVWGSAEVERIDRKQLASYAGVSLRTIHERRKKLINHFHKRVDYTIRQFFHNRNNLLDKILYFGDIIYKLISEFLEHRQHRSPYTPSGTAQCIFNVRDSIAVLYSGGNRVLGHNYSQRVSIVF